MGRKAKKRNDTFYTSIRIRESTNVAWETLSNRLGLSKVATLEMLIRKGADAEGICIVDEPEAGLNDAFLRYLAQMVKTNPNGFSQSFLEAKMNSHPDGGDLELSSNEHQTLTKLVTVIAIKSHASGSDSSM